MPMINPPHPGEILREECFAALGLTVWIPLTALAVYLLTRMAGSSISPSFTQTIIITTIFAGLPALLTAGGIGRGTARATLTRWQRRTILALAMAQTAVAGAGLAFLSLVPLGDVPSAVERWLTVAAGGAAAGAIAGLMIGLWCSHRSSS